jgi:hypothetical protein
MPPPEVRQHAPIGANQPIEQLAKDLPVVHRVRPFSRSSGEWNSVYDTHEDAHRALSMSPPPGFATTPEPWGLGENKQISTGDPELDEMLRKLDEPPPAPEPEGPATEVLKMRAERVQEREEARARFGKRVGLQKAKRALEKERMKAQRLEALEARKERSITGARPEDNEGAQLAAIHRQLLRDTAPVPAELLSPQRRDRVGQSRSTDYNIGFGLQCRGRQKLSPIIGGARTVQRRQPGVLRLGSTRDRGKGPRGLSGRAAFSPAPGLDALAGSQKVQRHLTGVDGTVNRGLYL